VLFRRILSVGVQSLRPNLTVRKDSLNYVTLLDSTSMEREIVFSEHRHPAGIFSKGTPDSSMALMVKNYSVNSITQKLQHRLSKF